MHDHCHLVIREGHSGHEFLTPPLANDPVNGPAMEDFVHGQKSLNGYSFHLQECSGYPCINPGEAWGVLTVMAQIRVLVLGW